MMGRDPFILMEANPAFHESMGWLENAARKGHAEAAAFVQRLNDDKRALRGQAQALAAHNQQVEDARRAAEAAKTPAQRRKERDKAKRDKARRVHRDAVSRAKAKQEAERNKFAKRRSKGKGVAANDTSWSSDSDGGWGDEDDPTSDSERRSRNGKGGAQGSEQQEADREARWCERAWLRTNGRADGELCRVPSGGKRGWRCGWRSGERGWWWR